MTDNQSGWPTQAPAEAPTRYFYHPESSSLMKTNNGSHAGEGGDGLVEEISAERFAELEAQLCGFPTQTEATFVAVEETPEAFIRRRDAEIQEWLEDKAELARVKEAESQARLKLTTTCFPNPIKGTQRYSLAGGYSLKLVHGWTYTLGDKDKVSDQGTKVSIYDQVAELERKIAALGPEGSMLAERLINWKPELKVPEYEALARDTASEVEVQAKELIDAMLTVKPASPQLALEEPKPPK